MGFAMQITNTIDLLLKYDYKQDTILFKSATPQTININFPINGIYEITCVGGGGGADAGCYKKNKWHSNVNMHGVGGGSGAAIQCVIYLQRGVYSVTVGAGGSGNSKNSGAAMSGTNSELMFNNIPLIRCGGGEGSGVRGTAGCSRHSRHYATPGNGGIAYVWQDAIVKHLFLFSNGLPGNQYAGGNSVFSGTEYGKGGDPNGDDTGSPGNNGFVEIRLL